MLVFLIVSIRFLVDFILIKTSAQTYFPQRIKLIHFFYYNSFLLHSIMVFFYATSFRNVGRHGFPQLPVFVILSKFYPFGIQHWRSLNSI